MMDLKTLLLIEWLDNENTRLQEEKKKLRTALNNIADFENHLVTKGGTHTTSILDPIHNMFYSMIIEAQEALRGESDAT